MTKVCSDPILGQHGLNHELGLGSLTLDGSVKQTDSEPCFIS